MVVTGAGGEHHLLYLCAALSIFNAVFHSLKPQVALSWVRQLCALEDAFARQLLQTRLTASFRKGGGTCGWEIHGKCPGATFALEAVRQHAQSLLFTQRSLCAQCWRRQLCTAGLAGWEMQGAIQPKREGGRARHPPKGSPHWSHLVCKEPWGTRSQQIMPAVCNRKADAWY